MRRLSISHLIGIALGLSLLFYVAWEWKGQKESRAYNTQAFKHSFVIEHAGHLLGFDLVDPEQAPADIRASVMRGYNMFLDTPNTVPEYSHNALSCTNCHFLCGDKLGGKNSGIPLVGVTAEYPRFSKRSGKSISLRDRICNCFERSMNGKSPSPNSPIMDDFINYLEWISKEVAEAKKLGNIKEIPWLGLPDIKNSHIPNAQVGKEIYVQRCAACHHVDGSGGGKIKSGGDKTIPPLWGDMSFNDGAGMSTMPMLSSFVYLNMPYQGADLTEEESLDVAAYVIEQKRPHYTERDSNAK